MSTDASTLPLGGVAAGELPAGGRGWPARRRAGALAGTDTETGVLAGALALGAIVALSLFVVMMAANRPSLLTPTTHTGYFPRWMAGPLGGLLPGFTNDGTTLKNLFTAAMGLMYCGYLVAFKQAPRLPVRWVIGAIVCAHAVFLLSPPLALTDLFNYVNYGRMEVVHNLNPYTTVPVLEPHSDPSFILSNWHQLLSPYGPLFTLLTFAVVPLGVAGSFWALKGILMLASLATLWLVWKCALLLGRDPLAAIALVGLNPLILVWGLGGDHNDFLLLLCIMTGFYLMLLARERARARDAAQPAGAADGAGAAGTAGGTLRHRLRGLMLPLSVPQLGAGAAFVAATALKASGGVLIPVVLVGLLRAPRALMQVLLGMLIASVVVGAASLTAFGVHFPDLSTQGSLVTGESLPNLLGFALGLGGETPTLHTVLSGVLVAILLACCWHAWGRRSSGTRSVPALWRVGEDGIERSITAAGWASMALLVTLGWILPWYVLWVLPLAALSRSRRLRVAALAFGVYLILTWAPDSGALWHAIGFHPERTPIGRLHQRYVTELLH
jgi:hypothetical protein